MIRGIFVDKLGKLCYFCGKQNAIVNHPKLTIYLGVLLIALLAGCNRERDARLLVVESCLEANPDSALTMLENIDPLLLKSDGDRAYHTLLQLEGLNMTGTQAKNLSLGKTITSYYVDQNKEPELLPRVYYALGRMHVGRKEYPEALFNFRKSLRSSRENPDTGLLVRTHAQIAGIFVDNKLYRHALAHTREQERLALNMRDTVAAINAALWIATEYAFTDDKDSVMTTFEKALPIVENYARPYYTTLYSTQLADFWMDCGDYEKADSIINDTEIVVDDDSRPSVESIINKLNLHFGRVEDVEKKSEELFADSDDIHVLKAAARNLALVNLGKGNVGKAIEYTDRFFHTVDSITKADVSEMVAELESLYSFSEKEQEKVELERKNTELDRDRLFLGIAVGILVLLGVVGGLVIRHRSVSRERKQVKEREVLVKEREDMIQERERMLREREEILENLEMVTRDRDRKAQLISSTMENADEKALVKELNTPLHKGVDRNNTLRKLRLHVGNTYPAFYASVEKLHLNDYDFNDALMIKVGLTIGEASAVMDLDYNALVNRRFRLAKKNNVKDLGFRSWADYILSLAGEDGSSSGSMD